MTFFTSFWTMALPLWQSKDVAFLPTCSEISSANRCFQRDTNRPVNRDSGHKPFVTLRESDGTGFSESFDGRSDYTVAKYARTIITQITAASK